MATFQDPLMVKYLVGLIISLAVLVLGLAVPLRFRNRGRGRALAALLIGAALAFVGAVVLQNVLRLVIKDFPAMREASASVGKEFPALTFEHVIDGRPGDLSDYEGQVVVLNLWATWCIPCIAEMPYFEALEDQYADRGVSILHLSEEPAEKIRTFLESKAIGVTHVRTEEQPTKVKRLPTTYVLDRQGVVRRAFAGVRSFDDFEKAVKAAL
ncbi:MAG: TlpA disulfide reductase family protein [Acidobacteriota bacterium]